MALAFVVPCQAGGSALLQPHGCGVADVLPAAEKIARERQREWGRGCEVLYGGGKCTSLPFLQLTSSSCRNGCYASEWYGWLEVCFLFLSFFGSLWCEVDTRFNGCDALTCLPFCASHGHARLICFDIEAYLRYPPTYSEALDLSMLYTPYSTNRGFM